MISVDKFARRLLRELNNWIIDDSGLVLYALVEEQIIEHGVLTEGEITNGVLFKVRPNQTRRTKNALNCSIWSNAEKPHQLQKQKN